MMDQRSDRADREAWSGWHVVELAATFLLFAGVMHFLYLGPPGIAPRDVGLPGHDSFYHVKMAALLPQIGLVDTFPWLRTTVFYDHFVNHHYGFQALLSPFVLMSHRLTGDYAAGGRWFITVSFGVSMALFQLLLMVRGIGHRWVWLALCLLLPSQFYGRHVFVRAINPSLVCLLLLCRCLFARRFRLAAVVIGVSIHIYLGSVLFAPALVLAMFVSGLVEVIGSGDADRLRAWRTFWGWRLLFWGAIGWTVGLATHPYGGLDVLGFLKLQVLGSGLSPDIPVGREWKSYEPAWFFVQLCGVTITVSLVALCVRLRLGPRLDTEEFALLLINILFLLLTMKARRFIEYWPLMATLSAAYVIVPPLRSMGSVWRSRVPAGTSHGWVAACGGLIVVLLGAFWLLPVYCPQGDAGAAGRRFLAEWRFWTWLAGACALAPIGRVWSGCGGRTAAVGRSLAIGAALCGLVALLLYTLATLVDAPESRIRVGAWAFVGLGLAYAAAGWIAGGRGRVDGPGRGRGGRGAMAGVFVTAMVVTIVALPGGMVLGHVQADTKCLYDLPALRALMQVLDEHSEPGDVVFTDDWDIFPVYFYLNHKVHYVVGLDPKFSHAKDPVLWERYVLISRGQVPQERTVSVLAQGRVEQKKIHVRLADLREHFGARFVIVDADHRPLASKLDAAHGFAERLFPPTVRRTQPPPYALYRILPSDEGE